MKTSIIFLFVFLAFCAASIADGPGTSDFAVMRLAFGARPVGMGEAFSAVAEGAYALAWNPAGLVEARPKELLLSYRALPVGVHAGMPAYARSFKRNHGIGATIQYVNYGEFPTLDEKNQTAGPIFSPFGMIGAVGMGTKISKKLSCGLSVKGVYEKLYEDYVPKGAGLDVGIRYLPDYRKMGLALVLQNAGLHAWTREFSLPLVLRAGFTNIFTFLPRTRFALDAVKPIDQIWDYRLGLEYRQSKRLFVRGGYSVSQPELERLAKIVIQKKDFDNAPERAQSWTAGAGYKSGKMVVDYAIQSWERLGLVHSVSLHFMM